MSDFDIRLDNLIDDMTIRTSQAYEDVITGLYELVKGKTAEEASIILNGINIDNLLSVKMSAIFLTFETGAFDLLSNTTMSSPLTEEALRSTLNNVEEFLASEFIDKVVPNIRNVIIDGIVVELEPTQLIDDLIKIADLSPKQIRTLVNSGYSQYSNAVKKMMFDKLPDNARFVYIGANDNKTRPACVKKIGFGPATKSDILGEFGNFDNEVWNCRHSWEEVTNDLEGQGFQGDI